MLPNFCYKVFGQRGFFYYKEFLYYVVEAEVNKLNNEQVFTLNKFYFLVCNINYTMKILKYLSAFHENIIKFKYKNFYPLEHL